MAEMLFPQRQRCKTCKNKLVIADGYGPLFGLYCTTRCAGIANERNIIDAPRECWTQREGGTARTWKRRYYSDSDVPAKLRDDPAINTYWCQHCGALHIGHSRIDLSKKEMLFFADRAAISQLLIKSRGQATLKQVAAAANVRPIRIKEWEDPDFDAPSLEVLFAILPLYRSQLAVALNGVK